MNLWGDEMPDANVLSSDVSELLIDLRMKQQVDALLRAAKQEHADSKDIRLSGNTKELVEVNLRRAVSAGLISVPDVLNAITEFEESKPHHRLYYVVNDDEPLAILNDPNQVRQRLFGAARQPANFPDLKAEPVGEQWADFRVNQAGWIAKLYRGGDRWVLNREESRDEPDRRVKVWTREYARDVWCVTWDAPRNLLTLQFPPHDIQTDYTDSYNGIRNIASKIISLSFLDPLPVTKGVISLINDYPKIKDQIRIVVADLGSAKRGRALLATQTDAEHLVDDKALAAAIKLFFEANEATIIWLKTKATDAIMEETRTIVGKRGTNNVQFTALSNPKALKYICDEIIRRSITTD